MSSDGPKSFKEMAFPPAREGTRQAIYAPLPPPPAPRGITQSEADKRAKQLAEMKAIINAAHCPLCDGQLDGTIGYDGAKVYCANYTADEYSASYAYGTSQPVFSKATVYATSTAYEIRHLLNGDKFANDIFVIDLTLNKRNQQSQKKLLTSFEGARFFLSKKLSEKQLLEKIKLYTVFS